MITLRSVSIKFATMYGLQLLRSLWLGGMKGTHELARKVEELLSL